MAEYQQLKGLVADNGKENITASTAAGSKRGLDVALLETVSKSSTDNTTTIPLGSGATYTGTGEQNSYAQVGVMLKTDNSGTLYFDFSGDGTNWDSTFPVNGFKVASGIAEFHTAVKLGRYFRVRLVNDTGAQTYLRLYTYFGENFVPSVAPTNQSIGIDSDAQSTRPTVFYDEVVRGIRGGVTHFTKWGYSASLTASAGEEVIWPSTNAFTPLTTASTFTIAYNNSTDGSGNTGALTLQITYVDANGLSATADHTLGSSGSDVTSFTGLGINRVAVSSSGSNEANANDITITATTGGSTQAIVPASTSVTQQLIYFTDSNSYAVGRFLWINVNKTSGGSSPKVTIKGYAWNRQIATKFEVFRKTIDAGVENTISLLEPIGFRFSPTDVFWLEADTDTNNAVVTARMSLVEYKID